MLLQSDIPYKVILYTNWWTVICGSEKYAVYSAHMCIYPIHDSFVCYDHFFFWLKRFVDGY